jgi:hypothetical protein
MLYKLHMIAKKYKTYFLHHKIISFLILRVLTPRITTALQPVY